MSRPATTSPSSAMTAESIEQTVGEVRHPLRRLARSTTVVLACLSFSALAACSVSVGTQTVDEASDIEVGECLQIGEEDNDGKVTAEKTDCEGTEGLTFYAADKVGSSAECTAPNTSALTFAEGDQKLCLTPNFASATCYQIPLNGGKLADYRQVACDATPAENTVVAKSVSRGDESLNCSEEQTKWAFAQPKSIGYCLTEELTA